MRQPGFDESSVNRKLELTAFDAASRARRHSALCRQAGPAAAGFVGPDYPATMPTALASAPCPLCRGERWLCVDHREPWPHDGCGAEGMACTCNPAGEVQWAEVYAEVPRDPDEPVQ